MDAAIKDSDIVAVFRAVHHLVLTAVNNPFLSLPASFKAKPAPLPKRETEREKMDEVDLAEATEVLSLTTPRNEPIAESSMFAAGPEDIRPEWLAGSKKFTAGIEKLGELLCARS